ncbi:lactococcin G-beta/enterocin 1071B family bacteriocin [Lacticaseibacillus zeae]|uniref:lactococcin G-beta/enterocin 1071B family bacteriocin n=1 Tax=Lacticaseibacillus zeae TaxID=57037 RepID=UPI000AD755CA
MNNFQSIDTQELMEISGGGKLPGWLGLLQPAADLVGGIAKGFTDGIKNHG